MLEMNDLSHWDLVDEFTAREAACLIFGFDPNDPSAPTWKVEPLLKRMRESYSRSAIGVVLYLQSEGEWNPEWEKDFEQGFTEEEFTEKWGQDFGGAVNISAFMELMGRRLTFFYLSTERQSSDLRPSEEVMTRLSAEFDQDTFRRPEISQWLSIFKIESKYRFDRSCALEPSGSPKTHAANTPKMRLQEDWIIEKIRELDHNPEQLPPPSHRGGVKATVKKYALEYRDTNGRSLFPSAETYDNVWERLRKEGRIAGGHLKSS